MDDAEKTDRFFMEMEIKRNGFTKGWDEKSTTKYCNCRYPARTKHIKFIATWI
jgi:hypothetical protein